MSILKNISIIVLLVSGFYGVYHLSDGVAPLEQSGTLSDLIHQAPVVYVPGVDSNKQTDAVEVLLSQASNKKLLVNFWASWCEACKSEKPFLKKLAEDHLDDLAVAVSIASSDTKEKVLAMPGLKSLPYPVLLDEQGEVAAMYGVEGLPQTLLFDERGRLMHRVRGPIDSGHAKILISKIKAQTSAADDGGDDKLPSPERTMAHFDLTSANGEAFRSFDHLDGDIWVANFIFTRCESMCPVLTKKMKILQNEFAGKAVKFVSISVDPAHDTPEALQAYMKQYQADAKRWHFLTGEWNEIKDLLQNQFKIGIPDKPIFHTEKFILVDKGMLIKGMYGVGDKTSWNNLRQELTNLAQASESSQSSDS